MLKPQAVKEVLYRNLIEGISRIPSVSVKVIETDPQIV